MITIGDHYLFNLSVYAQAGKGKRLAGRNDKRCTVILCSCGKIRYFARRKNEEIHIIPAAYEVEDTFSYSGTCVYMKSGKKLNELICALRRRQEKIGNIYKVYGVSNCGMPQEQVYYGLDELENAKGYLTTVIVKTYTE